MLTPGQLRGHIYASDPEESLFIGKRSEGHVSNYYIGEIISDDEVAAVQAAAEKLGIDVLNTRYDSDLMTVHWQITFSVAFFRVVKNAEGDFTLLVASVESHSQAMHVIDNGPTKVKLRVQYGDYSKELSAVVDALREV